MCIYLAQQIDNMGVSIQQQPSIMQISNIQEPLDSHLLAQMDPQQQKNTLGNVLIMFSMTMSV